MAMVLADAPGPTRDALGAAERHTRTIAMTKLEAAGNDFLVLLDRRPKQPVALTPAEVRALCDRHRGVGADGVILGRLAASPADLEMVLHNADGSEAEMSGNGIRCLVHAAVLAGFVAAGEVHVSTAAGFRTVFYEAGGDGRARARVDMGGVRLGHEVQRLLPGTRARLADVGNPHLVVIGDVTLDAVDLGALGTVGARVAGRAVNLEVARPGRAGADLELRVLERGVGETLACGTGTCAVAAVARSFGLVGSVVRVDNPGGRLEVRLGPAVTIGGGSSGGGSRGGGSSGGGEVPPSDLNDLVLDEVPPSDLNDMEWLELSRAELGGPVRKVADVEVEASFFASANADG